MSMLARGKEGSYIEVPEPLYKYNGQKIVHDDNLSILSIHKETSILTKEQVKKLEEHLKIVEARLGSAGAGSLLTRYEELTQEFNSARLQARQLKEIALELEALFVEEQEKDSESKSLYWLGIIGLRIQQRANEIREEALPIADELQSIRAKLAPLRADLRARHQIQQKLTAHYSALEDRRKEAELQRGMSEEALIIGQQIVETLSRLGFNHTYTKNNKTVTQKVRFDYVVATPDQLQYKILASKVGLFGGSVDQLPQGVYVTELIQEKVMSELSVSLEREVWSPHTSEDNLPLVNGAWIVVERLGLVEGIPKHVTYKQLMARYETAEHKKFPIPAGLRRGRRINWVHLDSPSGIHLMFTGISGSGKSNAMRAMVSAVIEKQSPRDIMFAFVDLKKQGDFREFEDAPHCLGLGEKGVLTEIDEVVEILQQVRAEMHYRQTQIGFVANNLIDYNKRVQPEDRMPRIVVVFDEYANTRRTRFSEQADIIDDICIEIGQVGRAAGISLWIGIQQPRRDNMPSSLRDNITTQFVGHQANVGAAQSVTGNRDSLKLEDFPGRMSASVGWKTEKVQMPFIPEDDVKEAVKIAVANYGDIEPYQLHYSEEGEEIEVKTPEQIIVDVAFEELEGCLKIYPLHDLLKPRFSRNEIKSIVERLIAEEFLEYRGVVYQIMKQSGNYYQCLPVPDNSQIASS